MVNIFTKFKLMIRDFSNSKGYYFATLMDKKKASRNHYTLQKLPLEKSPKFYMRKRKSTLFCQKILSDVYLPIDMITICKTFFESLK